MKPLFIPLKREYFELFASGEKTVEIRKYGNLWNERTCPPGRPAVISLGYGKSKRLRMRVKEFVRFDADKLPEPSRSQARAVYGDHRDVALIWLEIAEE